MNAAKQITGTAIRRAYRPWIPEPGMWFQWDWDTGPVICGTAGSAVLCLAGLVEVSGWWSDPGPYAAHGARLLLRSCAGSVGRRPTLRPTTKSPSPSTEWPGSRSATPRSGRSPLRHLLASSRCPGDPWTRQTSVAVIGFFIVHLGAMALPRGPCPLNELSHLTLAWAAAWFAGERTRLRREQIAELKQRALGANREAEHERRLAIAEERARIARDLHDSAGHAINVIVVRAGAARMRHDEDPERSLAALEIIENVARQTATEIDQIVGALRDPVTNGTVESPHGLASLESLLAHHTSAGLDLKLDRSGAQRELKVAVDQAAFRILQEALTNASRHGAGSAKIDIAYGERELEITVTNPVNTHAETRRSGGHGLIGMRERARLAGGSFQQDCANGNFRIHASISYGGPRP